MNITVLHNTHEDHHFGYRPGHPLTVVAEYDTVPDTNAFVADMVACEEAFRLFNIGDDPTFGEPSEIAVQYRRRRNRSLSVGDVVVVGTNAYAVASFGFDPITVDPAQITNAEWPGTTAYPVSPKIAGTSCTA